MKLKVIESRDSKLVGNSFNPLSADSMKNIKGALCINYDFHHSDSGNEWSCGIKIGAGSKWCISKTETYHKS